MRYHQVLEHNSTTTESSVIGICRALPFGVVFHPFEELLMTALTSGELQMFKVDERRLTLETSFFFDAHKKACRCVQFFENGALMVSGGSDNRCIISDMNGKCLWKKTAHNTSVNCVKVIGEATFASGDDDGIVKIWDLRSAEKKPIHELTSAGDYVTDMVCNASGESLAVTSGNTLTVFDLRYSKAKVEGTSDPQEDDLLCMEIVMNGKKLLCGSQEGSLDFFTLGRVKDLDDRLIGHPAPVEAVVKVDEVTVCTAAADGKLRIVSLFPNRIAGVIGQHGKQNEAIESIALNTKKSILASCAHDNRVQLFELKKAKRLAKETRKKRKSEGQKDLRKNEFFSDL